MSKRASLSIIILIALLSWGGLLLFTNRVPPHTIAVFIPFFLLLAVALTCTVAPIAYLISWLFSSKRSYQATIPSALRQGALFALIAVLNLMLRALSSWNIFTAILIVIAVIVVEVIVLAHR